MPAAFMARHHWSVSSVLRSNTPGSSMPEPHSLAVKVFGPKWAKAMNSRSSALIWFAVGTTCAALEIISTGLSSGSTAMVFEYSRAGCAQARASSAVTVRMQLFFMACRDRQEAVSV